MLSERVNYYEYLEIGAEASIEEIKEAIQAKKSCFSADGINFQELSKVMTNEVLRNSERESYIKSLEDNADVDDMNMDFDDDFEEITEVTCWNCENKYKHDSFFDNNCPICNAEQSKKIFKSEIAQIEDDIEKNCPKEQLEFALNELYKRYGASESYTATKTLDVLKERIEDLSVLDKTYEEINLALDKIEQYHSRKQIYMAYGEYIAIKDKLYSEGCFTDGRVVRMLDEYRICNEYLERLREASQKQMYSVLFPTISELKNHTIDCHEADEIMKNFDIPSVQNLKLIEENHRISLSWDYDIDGVSFSVHKSVNGAEPTCIQDGIYERSYHYNEPKNGAEITYTVWAHFGGAYSKNNPCKSVAFFDNVHCIVEDRVSGAVAFHWSAPVGCRILVCKAENKVPDSWEKAELVTEVNEKGFIDKKVKNNRKYGYKVKCIYNTDKGEIESKSINIQPCLAYFEFAPISIIAQNIDLTSYQWNVSYHPIGVGNAMFFKSERSVDISESKVYSINELESMGIYPCMAEIGENNASVPLVEGERVYCYAAAINEEQIYVKKPVEIIANGSIHDIKVNNIGDTNKTLEISFLWGEKSKTIAILDGDGHYYEEFISQPNMWYKEKEKRTGERDTLIVRLSERESHYLSVFEFDELGRKRLIAKLEPITDNEQELLYTIKSVGNKSSVTLFFSDKYCVSDLYLCKKYDDGVVEPVYGPVSLMAKPKLFKGITASFTCENDNLLGARLVLRFDKRNQSKVFTINNKAYLVTLKEKE